MGWFALPFFVLTLSLLIIHTLSYTSSSSVLPLCNHDDSSNLFQFKNSFAVNTSFYKHLWWRSQVGLYFHLIPRQHPGTTILIVASGMVSRATPRQGT
ncbi:hypothetical protein S83_021972 [Arachis hypogaea]